MALAAAVADLYPAKQVQLNEQIAAHTGKRLVPRRASGRQRLAEEVFHGETRVLTQQAHVDLDPDAATGLDTNDATDDSDFITCQRDEERDLRIKL